MYCKMIPRYSLLRIKDRYHHLNPRPKKVGVFTILALCSYLFMTTPKLYGSKKKRIHIALLLQIQRQEIEKSHNDTHAMSSHGHASSI